jgi:hypothetical protein
VVKSERLGLVKGKEHSGEEDLVFLLEGKGEAVDDRAEYLEKLGDTIVPFSLVHKLEEDVVDGTTDKRAQIQKLAVDPVKSCLQEVALTRVLRVEQLQQLQHKLLVDKLLADVDVEVGALNKAQEELVHDLEVGPGKFKYRLILLRVERVTSRIDLRRDTAEQVGRELKKKESVERQRQSDVEIASLKTYHSDNLWVD